MAKTVQVATTARVRATVPLVGRSEEVANIRGILEEAAGGSGNVTLISGEAGIGKTRLVVEAQAIASRMGFTTLQGLCFRGEGALPYRPWIGIISRLAEGANAHVLAGLGSTVAADLLRLVPELSERGPLGASTLSESGDRLRLMDSLSSVLLEVAAATPLLLVLEDLHWADVSSAQMLAHLSRRCGAARIAIVGTYRDTEVTPTHPMAPVLTEFSEARAARRFALRGLSLGETQALVGLLTGSNGASIPTSFIRGVLSVSEGNPYFIEEVVRHFQEIGGVFGTDGRLMEGIDPFAAMEVPRDVKVVLASRVERLDGEAVRILEAAAILGRQFEFEALREMTGLPEHLLLASIEAAMAAHLVAEVRSRPGRFEFDHALVQRTLIDGMASPRRERMHLGAAQALERAHASELGRWARPIAYHYQRAGQQAGLDKVVEYGKLAMEAAERAYAWDDVSRQFQTTIAILDASPGNELRKARFVCDVVYPRYSIALWDFEVLREHARRASQCLLAAEDQTGAAKMKQVEAYTYQSSVVRHLQDFGKALELFAEAEALTDDPGVRAMVRDAKPNVLFQVGRVIEADAIAAELVEGGQRRNLGLAYRAHYAVALGRITEASSLFQLCWRESQGVSGTVLAASLALIWHPLDFLWWLRAPSKAHAYLSAEVPLGRMPDWNAESQRISLLAATRESGIAPGIRARDLLGVGGDHAQIDVLQWLLREGDWDAAVDGLKQQHAALLDRSGSQTLAGSAVRAGEALRVAGRFAEAEEFLADSFLTSSPINTVAGHAALGLLNAELGRFEETAEHAAACRAAMTDDDWLGLGARVRLAEALAILAQGDRETAEAALSEAIADMRRVEHPWDEADAHYLFGKVLCIRDEADAGAMHFREALAIYERIQAAQPFIDRVSAAWPEGHSKLLPAGHSERSDPGAPAGLSARELEVLALLAAGRSNAQIAETLVLSQPTVATHVRHILEKTDTANRTEAAAWAVREGLA